jgi:hypothetical protein
MLRLQLFLVSDDLVLDMGVAYTLQDHKEVVVVQILEACHDPDTEGEK